MAKKVAKKKHIKSPVKKSKPAPRKSGEIFVNRAQLDALEASLSKKITSVSLEMKAGFAQIDSKLSQMLVLMEDQKAQNRFVLDGYASLHDEQNSMKTRIENVEKIVLGKEQI